MGFTAALERVTILNLEHATIYWIGSVSELSILLGFQKKGVFKVI